MSHSVFCWYLIGFRPNEPNSQKIHLSTLYETANSFIQKSILFPLSIMKSKDLQKLALSKYVKGDSPSDIFRHLNGAVCLRTVKRWCKMIRETGSINLSTSPGRPCTARTKESIRKVKDLLLRFYKKVVQPLLTDEHREKRSKFSNWTRTHFRKEDTMNILFSDEKLFDIDGICNSQTDRVWAVNRAEADEQGGVKRKRKFPQKVMVWLAVCSKGVSPIVIFDKGTVNHDRYIWEVLPVALKYGNKTLGTRWTFQQDGAMPHVHHLTQQWCRDNFPSFIDKEHWPPNSPDLNPLDYSIWDELGHAVNWDKVTSKTTLIVEVKRALAKIRQEVVFESCASWTNRLYRLSKNGGDYVR